MFFDEAPMTNLVVSVDGPGTTEDPVKALHVPIEPLYFSAASALRPNSALDTQGGSGPSHPSPADRKAYESIIGVVEF
jgi:hypothetical protein